MKLLDTNVLIHFLKGDPAIVGRMERESRLELAIPAIAVYALEYGSLRSRSPAKRRTLLERGLAGIAQVPFDSSAAIEAARLRAAMERSGEAIGPMDVQIAGIALSRSATLVTNNVREFSRIQGLRLEDWRGTDS